MSNLVVLMGPQGVRLLPCGEPYRLLPDEQVIGSASIVGAAKIKQQSNGSIGAGDLVAASLKAIGVTKKPGCGCPGKQQKLNRYRVEGPAWLKKWVEKHVGT